MTSRRRFLGGAILAALAPLPVLGAEAKPTDAVARRFRGPLGLQLYSLRHQIRRRNAQTVQAALAYTKQAGYPEIEAPELYGLTSSEFRRLLDQTGLPCHSMMATYEQYESDLDGVIRDAHTLGATHVVNAWIPHSGPFTIDLCKKASANYNQWGKKLRAAGLRFAHHNHDYEFQPYRGAPLYEVMLKDTDPEYVDFEMDVFWVVAGGLNPVTLMRRHPTRIRLLHLKDMRKGPPVHDYAVTIPVNWDVPLGTGRVNWPAVLGESEKIGVRRYFVEDESDQAREQIIQSLHYLKTVAI